MWPLGQFKSLCVIFVLVCTVLTFLCLVHGMLDHLTNFDALWYMLTRCLSSRPPSSFLFFLFWTVCVVHTQREEKSYLCYQVHLWMRVYLLLQSYTHLGCNDPLYPLIGLAAISSTSTGLSVSPCLPDSPCPSHIWGIPICTCMCGYMPTSPHT